MQDDDNYLAEALLWQGRVFALAAMIIYIYIWKLTKLNKIYIIIFILARNCRGFVLAIIVKL
jgi:hypothetical protein